MNHSKKLFSCALIFLLLVGAIIFGYVQSLLSVPILKEADASSLPELSSSSAAPETSSSKPSSLPTSSEISSSSSPEQSPEHSTSGQPDYSEIQFFFRSANWKQIVKNSPFKLGEPVKHEEDGYTFYSAKWHTYPHLDGSTVAIPMAIEFARQHLNFSDENASFLTVFSKTYEAYAALIQKEKIYGGSYDRDDPLSEDTEDISVDLELSPPDLIIVTEPSDEELQLAKHSKVTLVVKPVCYDAFVFITHKDNPIESLTIEQLQKIYSGEVTNWKEVGGPDVPIIAYQRSTYSGSQTAMENLVMKDKPMMNAPSVLIDSMGELVERVSDYQNRLSSIGYSYKYYVSNQYQDPNVKMIAIEGIEPTAENLRNLSYPLSTNYYGVILGGEEKKTGGKFLDWMLSPEGQACIAQAGYIPMDEVAWLSPFSFHNPNDYISEQ